MNLRRLSTLIAMLVGLTATAPCAWALSLDDLRRSNGGTEWFAGLRCFVARALGLQAGIDVARGPEESAVHITIGSAWR